MKEDEMNSRGYFLLGLLAVLLFACSSNRPLTSRGLSFEERRYYVIQSGYGIEGKVKQTFLDGFVCEEMPQELVFQLFGPPDRTIEDDTVWEYLNGEGGMLTGMKFEDKKIVKIMGDPRGGVPIEGQ